MRKLFLLGVAAVGIALVLFLSARLAVDAATERAFAYLEREGPKYGVRLLDSGYDDAVLSLPNRIYWIGVRAILSVERESFLPAGKDVGLHVEKAVLELKSLKDRSFRLNLEGMTVNLAGPREEGREILAESHDLIKGREAGIHFAVESLAPREVVLQARDIAEEIKSFVRTGRSRLPITFAGTLSFPMEGKVVLAGIGVEERGGFSVLVMDEKKVAEMARLFKLRQPLTEEEVRLVSANPLKAHRLFLIRTAARDKSNRARRQDRDVPEDAYRHVLWSYLLTKEYGEDFARMVTDAHEKGKTGNTKEEMLMDLANNRIGSEYARLGHPEERVLELVMEDRRVTRKPSEAPR